MGTAYQGHPRTWRESDMKASALAAAVEETLHHCVLTRQRNGCTRTWIGDDAGVRGHFEDVTAGDFEKQKRARSAFQLGAFWFIGRPSAEPKS